MQVPKKTFQLDWDLEIDLAIAKHLHLFLPSYSFVDQKPYHLYGTAFISIAVRLKNSLKN